MASSSNPRVTLATISRPPADIGANMKTKFTPLAADGSNYLEWENDARVALGAEETTIYLDKTTAEGQPDSLKCQVLILLRRHIHPSLRQQYIKVDHPADLWTQLRDRFHHEQTIFLPEARNEWINLRALDFP